MLCAESFIVSEEGMDFGLKVSLSFKLFGVFLSGFDFGEDGNVAVVKPVDDLGLVFC